MSCEGLILSLQSTGPLLPHIHPELEISNSLSPTHSSTSAAKMSSDEKNDLGINSKPRSSRSVADGNSVSNSPPPQLQMKVQAKKV